MNSISRDPQAPESRVIYLKARASLRMPGRANDVPIDRQAKAEGNRVRKQLARASSEGPSMTAGERR
jgi:hypothetical protein